MATLRNPPHQTQRFPLPSRRTYLVQLMLSMISSQVHYEAHPLSRLKMHPTLALRLSRVQLTLFTRANCGLCDVAKSRLLKFNKKQAEPIKYTEVDIMEEGQQKWRDAYDFDVPVLHIDAVAENGEQFQPSLDVAKKLMHRFTVEEVDRAVREVEHGSS